MKDVLDSNIAVRWVLEEVAGAQERLARRPAPLGNTLAIRVEWAARPAVIRGGPSGPPALFSLLSALGGEQILPLSIKHQRPRLKPGALVFWGVMRSELGQVRSAVSGRTGGRRAGVPRRRHRRSGRSRSG